MHSKTPTILIIFGITGDLAKRKLLPAVRKIHESGVLDSGSFRVVGITRRVGVSLADLIGKSEVAPEREYLKLFSMDLSQLDEYARLEEYLTEVEGSLINPGKVPIQRLFYLSIPPQVSQPVIEMLGVSGMSAVKNTKLLVEKPFGTDLRSAKELVENIDRYFEPDQVYRIDHYLAKEMSQNLLIFRAGNSLFKRTWNRDFIERIEIVASEKIGIEGRTNFYEQTGALRDIIQSHLLQLAALVLMDVPPEADFKTVPQKRLTALEQISLPNLEVVSDFAKRGQYIGYREEVENPQSQVETFVSLTLYSNDPIWSGVPITLITGKALNVKTTEIRLIYRKDLEYESNELILHLQPNEGVELCLWTKVPGYDRQIEKHELSLSYKEKFSQLPEAYEQVIFDAINSEHTLFTLSEEVLQTWRILEPIQSAWELTSKDLLFYEPGSDPQDII
jgi:glucose-6-phosphate 1-dehydrogenase